MTQTTDPADPGEAIRTAAQRAISEMDVGAMLRVEARTFVQEAVGRVIDRDGILDALPAAVEAATSAVLASARDEARAAADLESVRRTATGWLGIVTTATGLFGLAGVVFAGGAVGDLSGFWPQGVVLGLFALAVTAGAVSIFFGAFAAHGWPKIAKTKAEDAGKAKTVSEIEELRSSRYALEHAIHGLALSLSLAGVALVLLLSDVIIVAVVSS